MTLEKILENLIYDVNDEICPCEAGLPCPFYLPTEDSYCQPGSYCVDGMASLIRGIMKE